MTANELRIGNLFKTDEIVFVYSIKFIHTIGKYRVYVDNVNENYKDALFLDEINAIPLTEEWLAKFGFENKTKTFVLNNISIKQQTKGYFFYLSIMIQYVHQLQNLYFALTGEELKIN